ncbi:sodium:proton antiporter [Thermobrachium celere]|uniref:Putative Na(+) H(+) antiporter subunit C n=1 Tax=Thermobrachium celere DSM 8682 TaxID=941824 RepID=R7RSB9_9CLOT|nr:sodium:proton antiporter [Thermobrachium celere]GFR36341.1 cation:proton antiporter [Thermobrachium celere]CDF58145.1 putative Na(+) H(+) antiporter subunit C [Thermobrachium celere DSM 8682]
MLLMNYITCIILIVLGLYTIVTKKNAMKIVIGMGLLDYGINLLLISVGFKAGGTAPIFTISELDRTSFFVDPVPQALTLTSIVIGACVTALALALVIMINKHYGTLDTDKVRRLKG